VTGFLARSMAWGIGEGASAVRATVARGMSMDRDGFPGAVRAYGARREAPRMGSALLNQGRRTSPTTEEVACFLAPQEA